MIIVDAHEDIAYNVLAYERDYRMPAWATRRQEAERGEASPNGAAMLGLPDALLGRVAVVFGTLFVASDRPNVPESSPKYRNEKEAYALASKQMDYYQRLADETERLNLIRTQRELDETLATWAEGTEISQHQQGLVVLMENADPIIEPKQFEEWYERGVRIVGPAWQGTRYCGGTGQPGPLTGLGRELLEVMAGFNAILDLSHMAEASYLEAVERYEGILIASHSNPRKFCNTDRHLSDEMIRLLAERDGVMGIVMYNRFLSNNWTRGDGKAAIPLSVPLDAIDYICQLTGSAAHVGIGTDFDGGFGAESTPDGLDTISDLWGLGPALRARGYSEDDIAAILGGNMLRKLRQALPA